MRDKIIKLGLMLCYKIKRRSIRKKFILLFHFILLFITNVFFVFNNLWLSVYLISGKEKHTKFNISIIFIGNDLTSMSYINSLLFEDIEFVKKIGKTNVLKLKKINKKSYNADIVFTKIHYFFSRFLQKNNYILIPEWNEMILDITDPMEKILMNFNSSTRLCINNAKKYTYYYEITKDIEKLKMFYYEMYMPYITKRYGSLALYTTFEYMRSLIEIGRLFLVKKDEKYVFGFLLINVNKCTVMLTHEAGIEEKLEKNITTLSIYYSMLWAKEKNIEKYHFGYSRSFLNDGVLQYKKKWRPTIKSCRNKIVAYNLTGVLGLKINNKNHGVENFLVNNPFISISNNKLISLVFTLEDQFHQDKNHIMKKYKIDGIAEQRILHTKDCFNK